MNQYIIVSASNQGNRSHQDTFTTLEERVNAKTAEGYCALGGITVIPSITGFTIAQPMCCIPIQSISVKDGISEVDKAEIKKLMQISENTVEPVKISEPQNNSNRNFNRGKKNRRH